MQRSPGNLRVHPAAALLVAALGCTSAGVSTGASSSGGAGGDTGPFAGAAGAAGVATGMAGGGATEPSREGVAEVLLVDDFEDGDTVNVLGGHWHAFDDRHEGGESVSWPESAFLGGVFASSAPGYGERGYAARLTGTTGSVLGWDYIGLITGLGPNSLCPLAEPPTIGLPTWDGVQFMAKATRSSGPLYFKLSLTKDGETDNCAGGLLADSLTGYCDHEFDYSPTITEDWSLVRVPFAAMTQPTWGPQIPIEEVLPTAKEISWLFQTGDGEVDLWIDDVSLYQELPGPEASYPQPVVSGTEALRLVDAPEDPASGTVRTVAVADREFTSAVEVTSDAEPRMLWDLLLHAPTETAIEAGDLLHAELQARCVEPPEGEDRCRATLIFQRDSDPYTRSLTFPLSVGDEWTSFALPFVATESSAAGAAAVVLFLGFPAQTLAVGGLRVTNYGDTTAAEALAATPLTYEGREPDAPWRAEAAERIETHRRGELSIVVTDGAGAPVPGAEVTVTMTRPRFGFGTAVDVAELRDGLAEADRERYAAAVEGLFTVVVPENELKWPFLASAEPPVTEPATWLLGWAEDRALTVRGHNLVWPGWGNLPPALRTEYEARVEAEGEAAAVAWLRASVEAHVRETVSAFAGRLAQWDVINEPFDNHDLMDLLGEEAMGDWLRAAREADPTCQLFVNEYSVLARKTTFSASRRHLRELVAEWVATEVPLDGIGFQAHFEADLTAPTELLEVLDEFAGFGKSLWITEFDLPPLPAELAADYTRDLMTILFSHPSAGGFVMWGLWDGNHYARSAPIYDAAWNEKPSGEAYRRLVFGDWWTDEQGATDAAGRFTTRAFFGAHRVAVTVDGETTAYDVAFEPGTEDVHLGP